MTPDPVTIPPPLEGESAKRRRSRERLARVLWDENGARRLPREAELVDAMQRCHRSDVWWVCEANSAGPVYLLPTREWIAVLARFVDGINARTVLDAAAGDGFLAKCLAHARPGVVVVATDDGSWRRPHARMNARDRRELRDVPFAGISAGAHVERLGAVQSVVKYQPDLVIISWAPPGTLVDRVNRASKCPVLDISVDGDVCGNGMRSWRFEKDFLDGPIESRALCRLDERPAVERKTRVTLYYGAASTKPHRRRGRRKRRSTAA